MRDDEVELLPHQEELLVEIVGAVSAAPPPERQLHLPVDGGWLDGPGEQRREVLADDVWTLRNAGLLRTTSQNYVYGSEFVVTPNGFRYAEEVRARVGPLERFEGEVRRLLEGEEFQRRHPRAFERWAEAGELLWGNRESDFTGVGLKCLEAGQRFADELTERYRPPGASTDPDRTVDRLRAVFALHRDALGEKHAAVLEAMVSYWGTVSDLAERQKHGDQKSGEPLRWEDARAVVFQTGMVMFEIDRILGRVEER